MGTSGLRRCVLLLQDFLPSFHPSQQVQQLPPLGLHATAREPYGAIMQWLGYGKNFRFRFVLAVEM